MKKNQDEQYQYPIGTQIGQFNNFTSSTIGLSFQSSLFIPDTLSSNSRSHQSPSQVANHDKKSTSVKTLQDFLRTIRNHKEYGKKALAALREYFENPKSLANAAGVMTKEESATIRQWLLNNDIKEVKGRSYGYLNCLTQLRRQYRQSETNLSAIAWDQQKLNEMFTKNSIKDTEKQPMEAFLQFIPILVPKIKKINNNPETLPSLPARPSKIDLSSVKRKATDEEALEPFEKALPKKGMNVNSTFVDSRYVPSNVLENPIQQSCKAIISELNQKTQVSSQLIPVNLAASNPFSLFHPQDNCSVNSIFNHIQSSAEIADRFISYEEKPQPASPG